MSRDIKGKIFRIQEDKTMEKDVNYCSTAKLDFTENLDKKNKSIYSIKTHVNLINKLWEN